MENIGNKEVHLTEGKVEQSNEGHQVKQSICNKADNNIRLPGQNSKRDTVLRMFYNNGENFAEVFNKAVFSEERIRAEDLQELDSVETGIIDDKGRGIALHQERDVIKRFCNNKELMLFAIENSTYIDYAIPIKVLNYCCVNYNRQVMKIRDIRKREISDADAFSDEKNGNGSKYQETSSEFLSRFRKKDKINGIVTLLIYYGEEEWDGPLSLCDMMELSDEERKLVADYKILHFIDVMRLTPEQLEEFEGQVKILLGFLRYKNDSEKLERFIRENHKLINMTSSLTEYTISNMCNIGIEGLYQEILDIHNEEAIREEIKEKYREEGEIHMNEAFKQIFIRAKDEGRNEGRREVISNMTREGLSIDKIALYTGLSLDEVKNIQDKE